MAKNTQLAPKSSDITRSKLKQVFQKPALTSFYQCHFYPTKVSRDWIKSRGYDYDKRGENISLLCCEASLPGSQLVTNEITSDYHGVVEKHAYRRQYTEADFTFYVDHYGADGGTSYETLWFFENWMSHIANESVTGVGDGRPDSTKSNYFYRFEFPKNYQTDIYINKFERDFTGSYMQYNFLQAYPLSIASMPVSYDSSQLLKCTVTFTFTRYNVYRENLGGVYGNIRNSELLRSPASALNFLSSSEGETVDQSLRRFAAGALETIGINNTNF